MSDEDDTEKDARETVVSDSGVRGSEASGRTPRRQFGATFQLGILDEADGCKERGEIGALLRREGHSRCFSASGEGSDVKG